MINKEYFIKYTKDNFSGASREIVLKQIELFYECLEKYSNQHHHYKVGDDVLLKKGTLLHGTFRNLNGLKDIVNNGLIASWFINGRISKYPSSVGVWNLKKDYLLQSYINFYCGATVKYSGLLIDNEYSQKIKTDVISYDEMHNINNILMNNQCRIWSMEQTKEARFMPSWTQNIVQVGIIFDGQNTYIKKLLKCDILSSDIDDIEVKSFVNSDYYDRFIVERKNKDDFFTDRESAIVFGLPSCFIEGILVGREYENKKEILEEIKKLLPNCYICNLDGKVIVE